MNSKKPFATIPLKSTPAFLLLHAFLLLLLLTPAVMAAFDGEIYRTSEISGLVQKISKEYNSLVKDQDLRTKEIAQLKAQINVYERRLGGNPKKNKDTAVALEDAKKRKAVLEQKVRFYLPKISEKKNQIASLNTTLKKRQAEMAAVPKTPMNTWTLAQTKKAEGVYEAWVKRARYQLNYYSKRYSAAADTMQESARRENFLSQIKDELKKHERTLIQIQNRGDRLAADQNIAQKPRPAPAEPIDPEPARPASKPVAPVFVAPPPTAAPAPAIIFTPEPEVPKDFPTRFSEFLEQSPLIIFFVILIAGALGSFTGVVWGHPENKQPLAIAAPLVGLMMAVSTFIPFFGFFLAIFLFVIAFPAYFKVSLEDLAKTLPIGVGSFLGATALLLLGSFFIFT